MRVDQSRHDKLTARIDDLGTAGLQVGTDIGDVAVLDQDIGSGWLMNVAVVVIYLPAAEQEPSRYFFPAACVAGNGSASDSFRRSASTLTSMPARSCSSIITTRESRPAQPRFMASVISA